MIVRFIFLWNTMGELCFLIHLIFSCSMFNLRQENKCYPDNESFLYSVVSIKSSKDVSGKTALKCLLISKKIFFVESFHWTIAAYEAFLKTGSNAYVFQQFFPNFPEELTLKKNVSKQLLFLCKKVYDWISSSCSLVTQKEWHLPVA